MVEGGWIGRLGEKLFVAVIHNLLSASSQFLTFVFQSHVCLITSNAKPPEHFMEANRGAPFSPALSHLYVYIDEIVFFFLRNDSL